MAEFESWFQSSSINSMGFGFSQMNNSNTLRIHVGSKTFGVVVRRKVQRVSAHTNHLFKRAQFCTIVRLTCVGLVRCEPVKTREATAGTQTIKTLFAPIFDGCLS